MASHDEWQSGYQHTVPNAWTDGLYHLQQQHQQQNTSPQPAPLEQNQDQDQDQDQDDVPTTLELLERPRPISSWKGSCFNKPTTYYGNTIGKLMCKQDIEDTRNFELYRLHSVRFELNQGDTLVFIDYPTHNSIDHTDCNGIFYKSQELRVHSDKLLETGSSKFAEMLGPTYQFRIQRRRKMVNKLPEGIKYLLDLTPPSEGDELVFQMTELSLTPAITKWWSSYMMHTVDPLLVTGHADVCTCNRYPKAEASDEEAVKKEDCSGTVQNDTESTNGSMPNQHKKSKKAKEPLIPLHPERALQMKAGNDNEVYVTPSYRRVPDYCPIRHRNGILRLLMLIEGKGIILDSAIRVWTMVKIGTIFDCTSILRDRVTQWIMHGQNTTFIEVLPEEALQIAFALKIPQVAESSFRILVNELALKLAADKDSYKEPSQTTIFGRRVGDLPDELRNLVQHAAQALVDRVSEVDATMRNAELYDFWDIEEWKKLRKIEQLLTEENTPLGQEALASIRLLMDALVFEVTQTWDEVMTSPPAYNHETYSSIDLDRLTYVEPRDFEKSPVIMQFFNPVQMLLCAAPYNDVGVALDGRRWPTVRCKLAGHRHTLYATLVREATLALYGFLACNQRLTSNAQWGKILHDRPFPLMGMTASLYRPIVSLIAIELDVKKAVGQITLSWTRNMIEPPLNNTRHLLLTLNDNELKYLPLWCGGCDDGTGGVFEEPIPETSMGANGPGPAYHTGHTIPSTPSSINGSMIDDMDALRVWGSTTGASINVHDSISTVYRADQVIAPDVSIASDSFTAGESEYSNARYAVPADHQAMGEAINMTVETTDSESASSATTEGWNTPDEESNDSDNDMYMWTADSDSDDSTATIS
ncbi:Ff.00g028990.m01.CDS01 [Fusarium sp. VM40]|nr:Ff.00g028990.m01.CDS01 [Fusarium sp. VM40]